MKTIEVLLRDHVDHLGRCGDVVNVAAGYARNYLLPKRIAVAANPENRRMMVRRKARLDLEEAALAVEVNAKVEALSKLSVTSTEKADDSGHLYGSVSPVRIAELVTSAGFPLGERDVRLDEPIKTVGEHQVKLHVHGDAYAEIKLVVESAS